MEKKSTAQEIAEISNFFLSSSDKEKMLAEHLFDFKGIASAEEEDGSEVEETVSVRKEIAYPETENAQESMKKCLFQYLEEDYMICRIELKRTADISKPRTKKRTEEEILIVLNDAPTY
jgi:hypothetical protein